MDAFRIVLIFRNVGNIKNSPVAEVFAKGHDINHMVPYEKSNHRTWQLSNFNRRTVPLIEHLIRLFEPPSLRQGGISTTSW